MGSHVIKLILGVMLFNVNSIFSTIGQLALKTNNTESPIITSMQSTVEIMMTMMGTLGYLMGIIFILMGLFGIHKEMQGETLIQNNNENNESNEKEIIISIKDEPIKGNLDFENKELNFLLFEIQSKIKELKINNTVMKDVESEHMITKTENKYIFDIYNSYISIPTKKRNQLFKKDNPFELTKNQLTLILIGLNNIEDKMINTKIFNQKVNEKFLKEKIATI